MKKHLFFVIGFIFVISFSCFAKTSNVPVVVQNDDKVFMKISSDITKYLPKNIQILVYNIYFLNGSTALADTVNNNFKIIMSSQQFINKYKVFFIDDVVKNHPEIDFSFLETLNDQDLVAFGQNIEADVVLISSATLMQDVQKVVWDHNEHKFIKKNVILFQANIFNTKTNAYLMRISEYFLAD